MLQAQDISLRFGDKKLFEDVNIKFTAGNCYGLIGANGAGKSTFLKVLSGEIDSQSGHVSMPKDARLAVLKQDHYAYEDDQVLEVVMMGYEQLYSVRKEKDEIYMKPDFSDEDGMRAAELEGEFAEMNGYEAESDAAVLLQGLGISEEKHYVTMNSLSEGDKVKVLLAQALFGSPEVLLLDEPTNGLDVEAVQWLEEFLINFENTVIVVSHDRYFLNNVCTHIADLDFSKIQIYVGNYDFWYESSQLALKMAQERNKKKEEKINDLKNFVARFSANASKSKQATSRKKLLDKIELEDIRPSSRKYPYIAFKPEREIGNDLLTVENLSKTIDGVTYLKNVSFTLNPGDKVALAGPNEQAKTVLMQIITGEIEPDEGSYKWGITTSQSYFPKDNSSYFTGKESDLIDWLRQYLPEDQSEQFVRGFLGRMLFSGEEAKKSPAVLSGGEKVRCMLSKMMLSGANVLVLDEPTNHLDLESITALNNGLVEFKGSMIFASHDFQFNQSLANRIIELKDDGVYDKEITYEEYVEERLKAKTV